LHHGNRIMDMLYLVALTSFSGSSATPPTPSNAGSLKDWRNSPIDSMRNIAASQGSISTWRSAKR
jgi:hypothetical protein